MEEYSNKKRVRDDSVESESDSPEAKRIRDNLLDILDDSDSVVDRNASTQDLASFMKSFEEEIFTPSVAAPLPEVNLTSDSDESQPDIVYLLEASDDELGLPPTFSSSGEEEKNDEVDLVRDSSDAVGLSEIWGFEDVISSFESYDSLGFGVGEEKNSNGEFVTLEGLFDYSDPSDFSDFSWRSESLPAL
ncbi:hypothetical protein HHK36_006958 [Tetracentron sinense]|uniref:Uncharacterized protein n=1 Tax=Tetracentron sinense TaxID=13715 RepID=A0A835DPP2_TETSI|nr:hypothetical protein HHK36_006958 [Tetracentron sinense]